MFFFDIFTDDNKCGNGNIYKIKLLFTFIAILTIGFTVGLILFDSKKIFYPKKIKKTINRKIVTKTKKVESQTKARRKIS